MPVETLVADAVSFDPAEAYPQDYETKNPIWYRQDRRGCVATRGCASRGGEERGRRTPSAAATVYVLDIELPDSDRGVYASLVLRLAPLVLAE